MNKKYSFTKLALFFSTVIFSSCEKCTIRYVDTSLTDSKLNLQVELFENAQLELEDELMVMVNYKDQEFKKYVDRIEVIPIFNVTDTLKIESGNAPIYIFKLDEKNKPELLDVNIIMYREVLGKADTCLVFSNLKRTKHCYTSHAFH